ncbi:sel-1 like protein, partial [Perkinsela sp. CCAP 1560/4]
MASLMLDEENENGQTESPRANMLQYGELQAAQGNGRFHLAVGYTYLFGILGQTQNGVHAETHFLQALRQGHNAAYGALGQLYSKGAPGVSTNTTAAFEYFLSGAREGDVSSLNGLGTFFAKGVVVQRNVTKAVQYYKLSAFHGNPEAHYNLGIVYLNGIEDVLDVESAKHHLALASEKGMLLARHTLGTLYENGVGVERSCAKAVDLYKAVLKEGPRERRLKRAHDFYRNGMLESAFFNYLLSAENGQPRAELNLGILIGKQKFDCSKWNIPDIQATQL